MSNNSMPKPIGALGGNKLLHRIASSWQIYLFLLPAILYFGIFHYGPMYGIQIAFKNFTALRGIMGSPWAGLQHFERLFLSHQFINIFQNTVLLSLYNLLFGFPIPILFAILLNQITRAKLRKTIQTISFAPFFVSTVVVVAIMLVFTYLQTGVINIIIDSLGGNRIQFMGRAEWFRPLYIISEVWQRTGWDSIIYIAALVSISPELHEAAMMDGASKLRRIWHIDIPGILPTVVVMFILRTGQRMSLGFEKAFLMQTPLNLETSEIIATYVFKMGVRQGQFSFAAAAGLFNSLINLALILLVNFICKKLSGKGLW